MEWTAIEDMFGTFAQLCHKGGVPVGRIFDTRAGFYNAAIYDEDNIVLIGVYNTWEDAKAAVEKNAK